MNPNNKNSYHLDNEGLSENQRRGQELWQEARNWNGNNNPYSNYHQRHHNSPNYMPDNQGHNQYRNEQPAGNYGKQTQHNPYQPIDDSRRHHDENIWTERNDFKDDDYRYRSGHRDYWHNDYDREYGQGRRHEHGNDHTFDHRRHEHNNNHNDEGFFSRIGHSVSNAWNNMVQPDHDNRHHDPNHDIHYNRHHSFNRRDDYRHYGDTGW